MGNENKNPVVNVNNINEKSLLSDARHLVCMNLKRTCSALDASKYWYRDDVEICVLCGKETHHKERVYNENEKGTFWKEGVCWGHF